jgi:hypothetical protein
VGQALGRGSYLGALAGLAICGVMIGLWATGVTGFSVWLTVTPLAIGLLTGAGWGLAFGRDVGTDLDDRGLRAVPAAWTGPREAEAGSSPARYLPWQRVVELRPERRDGRTHVVAYLDTGEVVVLRAPYDGRFLARDREFDRKMFVLRHLWETHRRTISPPGSG